MSLINDALKKAQKLQMQGQAHSTHATGSGQAASGQAQPPPNPGGAPGTPNLPAGSAREKSMPGQVFMLLAFGAGVLIALSVLATVYLLRQPAASVVAQAPAAPNPANMAAPIAPEKPVFAPVINAPAPAPASEKFPPPPNTAPALAVTRPAPPAMPVLRSFSEGGSLPAVSLPALSLPNPSLSPSNGPALGLSNGLDPSKPDPKILAYLDAMQVAGVRLSDTGGKVLMNDRVFRQGEIVDHLLGLRLIKVGSDLLTFVDERGVIYTKSL